MGNALMWLWSGWHSDPRMASLEAALAFAKSSQLQVSPSNLSNHAAALRTHKVLSSSCRTVWNASHASAFCGQLGPIISWCYNDQSQTSIRVIILHSLLNQVQVSNA